MFRQTSTITCLISANVYSAVRHGDAYFDFRVVWSNSKAHQTVWNWQPFEHVHSHVWQLPHQSVRGVVSCGTRANDGDVQRSLSRARGAVSVESAMAGGSPLEGDIEVLSTRAAEKGRPLDQLHRLVAGRHLESVARSHVIVSLARLRGRKVGP